VHGFERAMQRLGKGWWGPSQFVLATRRVPAPFVAATVPDTLSPVLAGLAERMCCPGCRGELAWTPDAARCAPCGRDFARHGGFWDFAL
jgi:hypothetical protein